MLTRLTSRLNYLIKKPKPQYQNLASIHTSITSGLAQALFLSENITQSFKYNKLAICGNRSYPYTETHTHIYTYIHTHTMCTCVCESGMQPTQK